MAAWSLNWFIQTWPFFTKWHREALPITHIRVSSFCTNLAKEKNGELKRNLSRGIETLHERTHKHSCLQGCLD